MLDYFANCKQRIEQYLYEHKIFHMSFLQRRWDDGGKIWVEYQVLCHQNSPLHSVFFFYRVFTDLRNTQQQQTVYLSICLLMYIPAAWPGFEEFLRGLYILCMSFLPDRAHIRCITTTCLRIINKCNLKGEKGWYIYAGRGRYALRIRRKIPEISMFHSYI